MRPDVVNLRQFYASRLGRAVKFRLRERLRQHWPDLAGERVLGVGYATPLLTQIARAKQPPALIAALMPAEQGAMYWPVQQENRTVLGDVIQSPFAVNSCSRLLLMHVLEHTAKPEEMLRAQWEMLAPGGRLLLVVANRRGIWARFGATPYAQGTPYNVLQIKSLLHGAGFTLREVSAALYMPPSGHPIWLTLSRVLELVGRLLFPRSGGVLLVEAEKQIYAGVGTPLPVFRRSPRWQAAGISASISQNNHKTGCSSS